MRTIHKVTLLLTAIQRVSMNKNAIVRSIQVQNDMLQLWFECDTAQPIVERRIVVVGTGHEMPALALCYISTLQVGAYVWHFYEVIEP